MYDVQAVRVDRVRAQVDREDMAAVRAGDALVRVRALLTRAGRRSGVRDQVGALAERARRVDGVHRHAAGAVVGAEQPAPAGMHGQMARSRPTGCARAEHPVLLALAAEPDRGHAAVLTLVHRVQGAAVRVYGEVGRVTHTRENTGAGDTARGRVVGGEADAGAAALDGGVGTEEERAGSGRPRGRGRR
ncbi:hypothetical protein QFZ49_006439 [Streptomyces turgidiscabies]|uniref:Uncharacterized protein n=1 Tax=Streptomyces turgidiscabies TaxID=85558 RepID=A0ABU0RWV8_9ACTN|nr:hypothetical protein [Streptomyces turgidiscabies]